MKTKIIYLLFFLAISVYAYSQDTIITYFEVVSDSSSKNDLYDRCRAWFSSAFRSSKDVLNIQDKESGQLQGNGIFESNVEYNSWGARKATCQYSFSIRIDVRDGKYRYQITDIKNELFDNYATYKPDPFGLMTSGESKIKWGMVSQKKMNEIYDAVKSSADEKIKGIISDMKNYVAKKDNW